MRRGMSGYRTGVVDRVIRVVHVPQVSPASYYFAKSSSRKLK